MANESNQSNSEIKEFFVQHGSKVLVALAIILVVVAGVVQFKDSRKAAAVEQAEHIILDLHQLKPLWI